MTVADQIAERTAVLMAIKDSSNAVVSSKGGTAAADLSGLPEAIASIPSGGELPELTNPAEAKHVVSGKEYIDGAGNKQTGTLVVCGTVEDVEHFGAAGIGVVVALESSADGSCAEITLPEPNLLAENIKSGTSIFTVKGTAKTIRVETGTITPAEDCDVLAIEITGLPKAVSVVAPQSHTPADGDILGAGYDVFPWRDICGYDGSVQYYMADAARLTQVNATVGDGCITFPAVSAGQYSFLWRAGLEYQWTAYYWEDA